MNCREFQTNLYDFVDGALPESGRKAVQCHLDSCATCREFLSNEEGLRVNMRAALAPHVDRITLSDAARQTVLACGDTAETRAGARVPWFTTRNLALAASLVCAAIGATAVMHLQRHAERTRETAGTADHPAPASFFAVSERRTPLGVERTVVMRSSNGHEAYGYASATVRGGWAN
jgi:hypothetical protein